VKKFFVYATNSCLERILDCQKIHNYLLANGWQPVRKISAADLIIVSTCALTTGEDRSSVEYVRRCLNKKSPEAKIVIAGCLPVLMPDMLRSLGDFPIVPPTDLSAFDPLINPVVRFNDVAEPNDVKVSSFHNLLLKQWLAGKSAVTRLLGGNVFRPAFWRQCSSALRKNIDFLTSLQSRIDPFLVGKRDSLFYIRISRGCLGACSYCAKRHATGKLQSKPAGAVLAEFKAGLAAGRRYFFW
jgi:2-methylthioadenine synthetase